jgi:hypothetical protein
MHQLTFASGQVLTFLAMQGPRTKWNTMEQTNGTRLVRSGAENYFMITAVSPPFLLAVFSIRIQIRIRTIFSKKKINKSAFLRKN